MNFETTTPRTIMTSIVMVAMIISDGMAFTTSKNRVMNHPFEYRQNIFSSGVPRINSSLSRTDSLKMSAIPLGSGVTAISGAIIAGLCSGGLHAVTGPDHIAALVPKCCGQRWWRAGRVGALWGIGHSISATMLGAVAFFLKNHAISFSGSKLILHGATTVLEAAVGASLIFIGILGIKEAREWQSEIEGFTPQSLSAAATESGPPTVPKRSVILNGILHGFSWDGAPSLLPALAVSTWTKSMTFLLSYGLGTIAIMVAATTLIGEATRRAGEMFHRPDIPQKISLISSYIAMAIGAAWIGFAFT